MSRERRNEKRYWKEAKRVKNREVNDWNMENEEEEESGAINLDVNVSGKYTGSQFN